MSAIAGIGGNSRSASRQPRSGPTITGRMDAIGV
jgi:hypothetical protein